MPYINYQCTTCGAKTRRHHNASKCYRCNARTLQRTSTDTIADTFAALTAEELAQLRHDVQFCRISPPIAVIIRPTKAPKPC